MVCAGRDKEEGAGLLKGGGKGEKMEIHTDSKTDTWKLGDHTFTSRFILGSGKYSLELIRAAVEHAGAQIVTMALRRANEGGLANILDYIPAQHLGGQERPGGSAHCPPGKGGLRQ